MRKNKRQKGFYMDYQITWGKKDGAMLRDNEMSSEILADLMGSLFSLEEGARILEIGGGNDFFARAATKRGYDVTVLDCDENAPAAKDKKVRFIHADWASVDINDPALQDKFQVAVCNFSTAIQDMDSIRKINQVADQVLVNRFLMYKEPMMDRFCRELDLPLKDILPNLKNEYIELGNFSTFCGHRAQVHFNDFLWETMCKPKEAAERFLNWYYKEKEIPEGMDDAALKAAEKMAVDGAVKDSVKAHIAHLHWSMDSIGF